MLILPHTLITKSPTAVETNVGPEIILMSVENGECYGLGQPGSDIWRLMTPPITFANLIARLCADYDATPNTIESDLLELLEDFHRRNLITLT